MTGCFLRFLILPSLLVIISVALFSFWPDKLWFEVFIEDFPPAGIWVGIFTWLIGLSYLDIRRYKNYQSLLHDTILIDGQPLIVSGRIYSKETPLTAPFSGEDCLGYHYKITYHSSNIRGRAYEGYALLPSVIQSYRGNFKILAEPEADFFSDFKIQTFYDITQKARKYFSTTEFTEKIHEPGSFKIDKHTSKKGIEDLKYNQLIFEEQIIKANDMCLISGSYSTDPQGIAPHPDSIFNPFKIILNGEAGMLRKIRNNWIGIGVFTFLIAATILIQYLVVIKDPSG